MKTFDCVEMKNSAQEALAKEIEGLSKEELKEFWENARKRSESLRKEAEMKYGNLTIEQRREKLEQLVRNWNLEND